MLAALLALTLQGSSPGWCEHIRSVRALAHRDGLDETSFATLERRYCGTAPSGKEPLLGPLPPAHAIVTQDCADLWTMAVLARAARDFEELAEIDSQVQLSCGADGRVTEGLHWNTGRLAHQGEAWWYPSGRGAKTDAGWWYPSGKAAHNDATWWYPSGKLARSGEAWFDPETSQSSTASALLSWHCASKADLCNPRLMAMRGVDDEARTAGIIELLLASP